MTKRRRPGLRRLTAWLASSPLTVSVFIVTCLVSIVGLTEPSVLVALQRRPGELADGQIWRLLTSLLVHGTWPALIANMVSLAVIGGAAERRLAKLHWVVTYLTGGIVGELTGLVWQPSGAGDSVAILALLGAIAVLTLRRPAGQLIALGYGAIVLLILILADSGIDVPVTVLVGIGVWLAVSIVVRRRLARELSPLPPRSLAIAGLVAAVAITILQDIHGPAMLGGAVFALFIDGISPGEPQGSTLGT